MTILPKGNITLTAGYKFCTDSSFLNNQRSFHYVNNLEAGKNYSEWCSEIWMCFREYVVHIKIMLVIRRIYCNCQWNVCLKLIIYISCLPIVINPMYIQYLGEIVPPPSQNTVGVCNRITFVILHYISSRLVTLLKVIDAPLHVPNILNLTVSFNFLNFSFQIYLLFSSWSVV
jgi:hypothetical protein